MILHDFEDGNGLVLAHQHPKGRGWVADTATVEEMAYVDLGAKVYGDARVWSNAYVSGEARVYGNTQVFGNATICDNARVYGYAHVFGYAVVGGNARVYGEARVNGDARIYGDAMVEGKAKVYGNARVFDNSRCLKTPMSVTPEEFSVTITDNLVHINEQTYSFSDMLPLEEPYLSFVRGIIDQRKPQVEKASFWERL
jgi:carbonic anhydrase/acetyltransferase-like protein (isoleucine patch superfamily)